MSNGVALGLGLLVGAGVGAGATYILMKDKYETELEQDRIECDHENALTMTEEELRDYYIDQLRELGVNIFTQNDIPEDVYEDLKSKVNPVDDDYDEDEEEDEDDEDEEESPIEPNPEPYVIDEDEFGSNGDYSTQTLHYYKGDEVFTDEDNDILDNVGRLIGDTIDDITSCKNDSIYVRSEVICCDYEILIFDDSYAHSVEGIEEDEEELGDMADE